MLDTGRVHSGAQLEAALLDRLPSILSEVSNGLSEHWPDYTDFLESDQEGITEAAALFVHRLLEMSDPGAPRVGDTRKPGDETVHLVFDQIGRQQLRAGNDLTRLLTAFQLGARVAWRHVSTTALHLGMPPESLASLADAVFVFINELSFSAAGGYVQEQIEDARTRERSREELAELLLSDRAGDQAVRAAANRAGWRLPATAAVVLVDPEDAAARLVLDRLEPACLPIRHRGLYGAIVPDPSGPARRTRLAHQLQGAGAVIGYAVAPARLPRSTQVAQIVVRLRRDGVLHGDPIFAEDHLDTVIVWRDAPLLEALRRQALAPLDDLSGSSRDRLTATLTSWLRHQGDVHTMAEELSIHPQTVRYRMAQVREHFGDALDSPRVRARLFLALEWPES